MDAPTPVAVSRLPSEGAYVRTSPGPFMRPPAATIGVVGWIRANLFPSVGSGAVTVLIALLLLWIVPQLIEFLVVDAVWTGSDREEIGRAHV